jgi:O-acetyl-ADP-ribose deacetylase (regulator of RNase III)
MTDYDIFISYRRQDSIVYAHLLYARLNERFPNRVFLDVARLKPGMDFGKEIAQALSRCKALVGLIGTHWATNAEGVDRFADNEDNLLLAELSTALEREILVIPVLVGGASLPTGNSLPEALHPLLKRQVLPLDNEKLEDGIGELVQILQELLPNSVPIHVDVYADRITRNAASSESDTIARQEIDALSVEERTFSKRTAGRGAVVVMNDDICRATFEVIVSSDDNQFTAFAGVSKAISQKTGPDVRRQLDYFARQEFRQAQIAVTTGGDWQRRAIIHAVVHDRVRMDYPTLECIRTVTRKALECADAMGAESIAFPVLGGGFSRNNFGTTDSVNVIASEVLSFLKEPRPHMSSVNLVGLYIFKREDVDGLPAELLYPEKLFDLWPNCYHVTSKVNLTSIRRSRRLLPAQAIFKKVKQDSLCRERRTNDLMLYVDGHDILIRNQRPLDPEAVEFGTEEALEDYVSTLNSRVFFWPGTTAGPVEDGVRMFDKESAGSILLTVPFRSLVDANPQAKLYVSTCNTGAAWRNNGRKTRRGQHVFEPVHTFSGYPGDIMEISFVADELELPSKVNYAPSLAGPWHALF